ncbi:MAG: hypothetical protein CM15mP109_01680 [Candidatus Dadabacteria bacterium]|nr:MAG: hypothetical protein CM15mP109_01680 [Candidatus Dadabacteria bacterium]
MNNMTDSEKNKNIIIVDDDQTWLNQLSRAFERRGIILMLQSQ